MIYLIHDGMIRLGPVCFVIDVHFLLDRYAFLSQHLNGKERDS
jgi:hypothetical protein